MPSYKLIYFPFRARGETTRALFNLAGVEYENAIQDPGNWSQVKPTTPWGGLPVLIVDGQQIAQSLSVNRFVAKRLGFMGKNDVEEALIDSVFETVNELIEAAQVPVLTNFFKNTEAAEAKRQSFIQKSPGVLASLERFLISNKGGDGYFVGDSISLADIHFFVIFETATTNAGFTDVLKPYPKLTALFNRVAKIPNMAKYLKERPQWY